MKNTEVPVGATAGIQGLNENGYVGGTRIWKKITRNGSVVEHRVHIHAGPNLIAEYNAGVAASTPVQEYVYGGEIDSLVLIRRSDATKYGVTRNRQWSITALHDLANGNVVERYAYDMTGNRTIFAPNGTTVRTTSSFGNNFGYTSRWHDDESGLMYFRARYYNPLTGEFLSRDPMEFVDGMSLYRGYFGMGDFDPSGLCRAKKCLLEEDFGSPSILDMDCQVCDLSAFGYRSDAMHFGWIFGNRFLFDNDNGACECCEYRQYVLTSKFEFRIRELLGGMWLPVEFDAPIFETREDCVGNSCYGHRRNPEPGTFCHYSPDRLTGCEYVMVDTPGASLALLPPEWGLNRYKKYLVEVQIELRFLMNVIDVCSRPDNPEEGDVVWSKILDLNCRKTVLVTPFIRERPW
jgi:RHS repeat-associated protein